MTRPPNQRPFKAFIARSTATISGVRGHSGVRGLVPGYEDIKATRVLEPGEEGIRAGARGY